MGNVNQLIDNIGLSVRTTNVLKRSGIFTVADLLNTSRPQLSALKTPGMGKKTIDEAINKADELRAECNEEDLFSQNDTEKVSVREAENFSEWIQDSNAQAIITAWAKNKEVRISSLGDLSARAYNILFLNNFIFLYQTLFLEEDELMRIPRMDKKSAQEIIKTNAIYLENNKNSILSSISKENSEGRTFTFNNLLTYPNYRERIIRFVKINDADLLQLGISQKVCKKLRNKKICKLSDFFSLPWDQLQTMYMVNKNEAEDIIHNVNAYLKKNEARLIAFCNGDESVLWDEDTLSTQIINAYEETPFRGYSLDEFREKLQLSDQVPQKTIKEVLGKLIAKGYLEYVDYRCYRTYKRFAEIMESCTELEEWKKEILRYRLSGYTLEEIGNKTGRTRESVRQTLNLAIPIVRNELISKTGSKFFDEDYYQFFFQTYEIKQAEAEKWLGIPASTWYYLEMINTGHGKNNLENAIDDYHNLDLSLRLKIKNFINNSKLWIDGVWVKKKRESLEKFVIQHYCKDEVSVDEFIKIYNSILEREEVDPNEDVWLDEKNIRSRKNHISPLNIVLWSINERFRYYDINGRDFSELIDTINLESYENIEISTLKFMREYPDIMRRYDIRNHYELHNLLKKIIPDGSYNQFHCGRMPILEFGTSDRAKAISNLIINNSPLTQEELITLIYDEFGFEMGAIPWSKISKYKAGDVYRSESKIMSNHNMQVLLSALSDNFYYLDEIRQIYSNLFPECDLEEINSYNLKSMGFVVYPHYAIQNYTTEDSYFHDLLTKDDIVDLAPLRKRFAMNQSFYGKLQELRHNLKIIEFEPNKVLNIRKLLNNGISIEDLEKFCDDAYDYVPDNKYFSMKSLRKSGFTSDLFELGFSDWFYANLLAMDDRFAFNHMFSNIILYKGKENITIKSFGTSIIQNHESIDTFDLMRELEDVYGCHPKDKYDILYKVQGEDVYYDKYLDRLYASEDIYYQELDSMENDQL